MKKRGFTLIEMLIVIVIIGILAGALIPRIGSARDKANDTAREANVRSLATAMVSYGMDHGYESTADATTGGTSKNVSGVTGTSLTLNLQAYSIPTGNFNRQPTENDLYFYNRTADTQHFVIFALLAGGESGEGGNCDFAKAAAGTVTYNELNAMTTGNAFCYFQ